MKLEDLRDLATYHARQAEHSRELACQLVVGSQPHLNATNLAHWHATKADQLGELVAAFETFKQLSQ